MIGVAVLGASGSIGENTLDVIARNAGEFAAVALGAHRNVAKLAAQCERFRPLYAAMVDPDAARELERELRVRAPGTRVVAGQDGLDFIATLREAPYVVAGVVGAAGLRSALAAAGAGQRLMIANKEPLVMAGDLLLAKARASGATLLPIDSEHNAIFQCLPPGSLPGVAPAGVRRIVLTASGGPFLDWTSEALARATPAQACAHPNWVMGRKISVDSATLMNKGLEVIEARILFGLDAAQVQVVVHRQSIVHSLVEFMDGSMLAQLGPPDMRTPITHALAWPRRLVSGVQSLDLVKVGTLNFEAPDPQRFRCLQLADAAARAGGLAPAVLNAANEIAVAAFLEGRVNFPDIAGVIESVLSEAETGPASDLEAIMAADGRARALATQSITRRAGVHA